MQRWQVAPLRYAEAVCKYWNILHLILYYCSINVCSISKKSNKKENLNRISVLAVVILPVSLSESLGQVNCAKEKVLCNKEGVGEPGRCWTLVDSVLIFVWMLVNLPNCAEETRRLSFFPLLCAGSSSSCQKCFSCNFWVGVHGVSNVVPRSFWIATGTMIGETFAWNLLRMCS